MLTRLTPPAKIDPNGPTPAADVVGGRERNG